MQAHHLFPFSSHVAKKEILFLYSDSTARTFFPLLISIIRAPGSPNTHLVSVFIKKWADMAGVVRVLVLLLSPPPPPPPGGLEPDFQAIVHTWTWPNLSIISDPIRFHAKLTYTRAQLPIAFPLSFLFFFHKNKPLLYLTLGSYRSIDAFALALLVFCLCPPSSHSPSLSILPSYPIIVWYRGD